VALIDDYIDTLHTVLPAKSKRDIRIKMSRVLGRRITDHIVCKTLTHLRTNYMNYGWTVPHIKKGPSTDTLSYFAVKVDHHGDLMFDRDAEYEVRVGLESTVATVAGMGTNEAVAIKMAMPYVQSLHLKRKLTSFNRKLTFLAEEAQELLAEMRAA
jgi:hypothetical protein